MDNRRPRRCSWLMDNLLVILTFAGVIVGMTIGILVKRSDPTQDVVIWIGLPGDVYMGSLKMVVLPLIVTSVVTGTASLDPKCNGRVSIISLAYIITTNSLACIIPIIIAVLAKPGTPSEGIEEMVTRRGEASLETIDVFADLLRNLFPPNIITACFEQYQTQYEYVTIKANSSPLEVNTTTMTNMTGDVTKVKVLGKVTSTNVLGLVICSFILGLATSSIGEDGRPFLTFFNSANYVIMKVLSWLIWTTPVGVASLIAAAFLKAEHLDSIIESLGMFSLVTMGCLVLHVILLAVLVQGLFLRSNPIRFLGSLGRAYTVTFATTSTAMAIPTTLDALENKNNIDSRVTRFVVPLATTINRDGSSIFIAVSCVFLSQMSGYTLNTGQIIILWTLLTFISMATPSVPSSSIVVVIIILSSLGIPTHLVGLLFATEWILDRVRSCVNMTSHCYCSLVVEHLCRNTLLPLPASSSSLPQRTTTDQENPLVLETTTTEDNL